VKFDKDKIIQVILNLLNNALRATQNGGVTILSSRGDNYVQVSVRDTGIGIKKEDMGRLFQKFEQIERKSGGSGLGLVITKGIIEEHKGKIWVESVYGQGTTFHFVLPIEEKRK
jgi:signal transduction histidine kinase